MKVFTIKKVLLVAAGFVLALSVQAQNPVSTWDGSRSTPVHRIPVLNEEGGRVVPTYDRSLPFSARQTCGPCHDYETVSMGLHFNAGTSRTYPGRAVQPWILVDTIQGTQIPMIYRGRAGAVRNAPWNPEGAGLTAWDYTLEFGRHLPGGGVTEPREIPVDPDARWTVSGPLEINCMACHSGSHEQDMAEWAKQIARQNLRWAATAANGLGEVGGMASRMGETWTVHDGPNLDDTEYAVAPYVKYDLTRFDSGFNASFDVRYPPLEGRCLQCHSNHNTATPRWEMQRDVHSSAGMSCGECHRNGLAHRITRGYVGEARDREVPDLARFTCRGCHLGWDEEGRETVTSGIHGAPRPEHKGLPPVHFEKMTCTACHSGEVAGAQRSAMGDAARMRTSRANRLGIHGKARWDRDLPAIAEPVLARDRHGRLGPHRAVWPAFWARVEGSSLKPVDTEKIPEITAGIVDQEALVGASLAALATIYEAPGEPVLYADGVIFAVNIDGEVDGSDYAGTRTLTASSWLWRHEDAMFSDLVPSITFDDAGYLPYETETLVLNVLEALRNRDPLPGEPVLVTSGTLLMRDLDGLLATLEYKAAESAPWFGYRTEDTILPLAEPFVIAAVAETDGTDYALTPDQVARILRRMEERWSGDFGYVNAGRLWRLAEGGQTVTAEEHADAEPVLWPVGHDVRPAEQSIGGGGCTECHAPDAPYLFGEVRARGPLKTSEVQVMAMHELTGLDANFQKLFGWTFHFRPLYKWLSVLAAVMLGLLVLSFALAGTQRLARCLYNKSGVDRDGEGS